MFNDKQQEKSKKLPLIAISATVIALALTFGYTSNAYAQIQAKITKPVLRTDYKGTDTINLDNSVNLMNGNRKISVSLRDSDLKQTLRMIADKAGLNIIFHSSVTGTITLDLVNVSLNDAFKMIMQASDLSFVIEKGTLIVMSKDASSKSDIAKQNMMTIPVKYADSSKVADFLNSNVFSTNRPGLSNNKIVVTNPVTNELVIFGTQNDYKMAQKIVSGTNLGDKEENICKAIEYIERQIGTIGTQSAFYVTEPWGFTSQNTFVNAVVEVKTTLSCLQVLSALQHIEKELGRTNKSVKG